MKHLALTIALCLLTFTASGQSVRDKDLKPLEGQTWIGTLTYRDYGSGKKTLIKSNLSVQKKSGDVWSFSYVYPDEPKANSSSEVILAAEGKMLNGQIVASREKTKDGRLEIVTTEEGDDDGKKALFRYTYSISRKVFEIRKDVQYIGETIWLERNTYRWRR
ncbi:MAG: hypothetical protein PSX80_07195 [bacterium]|nr:hypothetical protein [bacterium]